jgi:hypothetical protein
LTKEHANHQEWISIQEGICLKPAQARGQFLADVEFGHWCDGNGLGSNALNPHTRAAAITMGGEPEALRKCLEATERRSLRMIHQFDFGRFASVGKPTGRRKKTQAPQADKVREEVRSLLEEGQPINRESLADKYGVGPATIQRVTERELGRIEGLREASARPDAPVGASILGAPQQKKFEALKRRYEAQFEARVEEGVMRHINEHLMPHYKEKLAKADSLLHQGAYKAVFTNAEYRILLSALHPDSGPERRAEAFDLFKQQEMRLRVLDKPLASDLPSSISELWARRKNKR